MLPNLTHPQFQQILVALDTAIKVADSGNPRNRESFRLMHRLLRLKLRVLVLRDRQTLAMVARKQAKGPKRTDRSHF